MSQIVTVGETMIVMRSDAAGPLRLGLPFTASIAGAEATVAIGLARLGHPVAWAGVVGDDPGGAMIVRALRGEGVDVSHVRIEPAAPTGLMLRVDRTSERAAVRYYRGGSAGSMLRPSDVYAALGPRTRILHLTGITGCLSQTARAAVIAAVGRARELSITTSFDVNYRRQLASVDAAGDLLREILPGIGLLFVGADEIGVLQAATGASDPVRAALDAGIAEVVVKDGRAGATVYTGAGQVHAPAPAVSRVVDVIGAGDAFVAGYLSAWIDDAPVGERLQRGALTAGFCVSTLGDWEGLPSRGELDLMNLPDGTTVR